MYITPRLPASAPLLLMSASILFLLMLLPGPGEAAGIEYEAKNQFFEGRLTFSSDELRTMTPVDFVLSLRDMDGNYLSQAQLDCTLDMPAMEMPANQPAIIAVGQSYRGQAIFTMAGSWVVRFDLTTDDRFITFHIPRVRMK